MPECTNPLWPCAMTGAAACLAGFRGLSVVIHGSSGCYFYPTTLLRAPLHGTFIVENEIIFGSADRLRDVIGELGTTGDRIAVITTCVPAILGEDVKALIADQEILLVDSPGFSGDAEIGYSRALALLNPGIDPRADGVNIGGVCLLDPFHAGNVQELRRLLARAGIPVGTVFCQDSLERVRAAAPVTIGTCDDFSGAPGEYRGSTLGIDRTRETFGRLAERFPGADVHPVLEEAERQEEEVRRVCDKYLRRADPPSVGIFAGASYAEFAARTLERYLDAEIRCIGLRNPGRIPRFPTEPVSGLAQAESLIGEHDPDLVLGSSFERPLCTDRAFLGITPPLRGSVRLAPVPLAGINGTLFFMEQVLNACRDHPRTKI